MIQPPDSNQTPRQELLAGKVLGDLSSDEMNQLNSSPSEDDAIHLLELERAAAALQVSFHGEALDSMPEEIKQRVLAKGIQFLQKPVDAPKLLSQSFSDIKSQSGGTKNVSKTTAYQASGLSRREWIAWVTCAASLLLAFGVWMTNRSPTTKQISLGAAVNRLVSQSKDLIRVEWTPGKTPLTQRVNGEVLWSNEQQIGFMKFDGLPRNDPSQEQYQLWIIDPSRDDEPIDGGVFDIADSGESIIQINAKLKVIQPTAFAITVEKPGGVVVSTQARLPLLAVVK